MKSIDHSNSETEDQKKIDRAEYQRQYYRQHRERLLAYQKEYSRKYKTKVKGSSDGSRRTRTTRRSYNQCDIMQACPDKAARMIDKVLSGEMRFAGF